MVVANSARSDDDILSEFSDDDFVQELDEEKAALRLMQELTEWVLKNKNSKSLQSALD
jgi:hypothetical protein